ncbi:MAG: TIGR03032 family protein [Pirellulaceae bacterium]|nr:TIGR03032 family protein [Pirellulaceae bacterium]
MTFANSDCPFGTDLNLSGPAASQSVEFRYSQSESLSALLKELGVTLLVSTYQANKLLAIRAAGDGISTLVRSLDKPMGMAVDDRHLTVGTRSEVWFFRNAPDIAREISPINSHDACFLPRSSHVTGDIGIHEIARGGEELWIVSTRFSCLCTLDPSFSFVPRWSPPFITALAAEDRCHLNGLAMRNNLPAYVTALGISDTKDGWRERKSQGGCILDVLSGETISQGMSMPHSPRWHDDKLWVLASGIGGLLSVDLRTGKREIVVQLPGFTRGLAIAGPFAFVGLSKIRPTSAMAGVAVAELRDQLKCGVAVIDLRSGTRIAMIEFHSAVEEIFDIQLLSGIRFPEIVGFQKEAILHTFALPQSVIREI